MKLEDLFEEDTEDLTDVIHAASLLGYKIVKEEKKIFFSTTKEYGGLKVDFLFTINPKTESWTLQAWVNGESKSTAASIKSGEDADSLLDYMKKMKFTARRLVNLLS